MTWTIRVTVPVLAVATSAAAQGIGGGSNGDVCDAAYLQSQLSVVQAACCTGGTSICTGGMPRPDAACSAQCAQSFTTLWDRCGAQLQAQGYALGPFYADCLDSLYHPGQCGDVCTVNNLSCRYSEVNRACCSLPGACPAGSAVPQQCSVDCALVVSPFVRDCGHILQMDAASKAQLEYFAHSMCLDQDLSEVVEYASDLKDQGCSIEFGVPSDSRYTGGWTQVTPSQVASANCTRINGDVASVQIDPAGRTLGFIDFQEAPQNSGTLRCEIAVPSFTQVRGSYSISPQDPVTGVPQDPDNTYMLTSWGEDPPWHAGAFVFGTEHDMVDRGEESGTYRGQYRGGPHTITIPQTTVTPSNFIRFEEAQSANHEDFLMEDIQIEIFVEPPSTTNIIVGGSFEAPVATAWNGGTPPGWSVTDGNVDWGSYRVPGHCQSDCAYEGIQFLDTCGQTAGRLEQVVQTVPGTSYLLSYALNGHQGCGGATKTMDVFIDGQLLAHESFHRSGSWANHNNEWVVSSHQVTAASSTVTVAFQATTSSCGCMLIDDVQMIPSNTSWWQPAGGGGQVAGGGHRRTQTDDFFTSSVAVGQACPWDVVDDRIYEVERICCAAGTCAANQPPSVCTPLCAVAFHGFWRDCRATIELMASRQGFEAFDAVCTSAGTVNMGLFLDALSHAECCSSRNCGGCVDAGQCHAVDAGDHTGDSSRCTWNGPALTSGISTPHGRNLSRCAATGNYYEFVDTGAAITWADARVAANARGGHLVSITSQAEQDCLLVTPPGVGWLGGNDVDLDGSWEWTTGESFSFTNWATGEPSVADGPSAHFIIANWPGTSPGTWHRSSDRSASPRGYFVEYEQNQPSGCVGLEGRYPIYATDGGGWMLVRRVAPGPAWHAATDQLRGDQPAYGTWTSDPTMDASFGIPFNNLQYDQLMFATGDGQQWLIVDRDVVTVQPSNPYSAQISMSSTSATPYQAQWYYRAGNPEDPWISLTDHSSAIGQGNLLYGENGYGGAHAANVLPAHNGANVFIRLAANRAGCRETDVTQLPTCTPIALVMSPTGSGNRNISIIRDGVTGSVGDDDSSIQYDTYNGDTARSVDWVGYSFTGTQTFSKLEFTEGRSFGNGGWFDAAPSVEILQNGLWQPVSGLQVSPNYLQSARAGASARSFESFSFTFTSGTGNGIRLIGPPGGARPFISVAELRVFALHGASC